MFEASGSGWVGWPEAPAAGVAVGARTPALTGDSGGTDASDGTDGTGAIVAMSARLRELAPAVSQAANVERIRLLEELKAVCAAVQARETAALHAARGDAEADRGVPAARRCRGVGAEVALARGESPTRGSRHVGLALALVHEMPHTMAALTAGTVSEWRATLIARETAWLPVEGRRHVDEALAGQLAGRGDRTVAAHARALAQAYDPLAATEHLRRAERERRVSVRPAPDAMVYLSALLPMVQGVAAYAALDKAAAAAIGTGEAAGRTRAQVMADVLVERLTGQHTAAAVPVEVHLVMSDRSLLEAGGAVADARDGDSGGDSAGDADSGSEATASGTPGPMSLDPPTLRTAGLGPDPLDAAQAPAWLVGHGPMPAPAARALLDPAHDHPDGRARVWLRRLYTDPESGRLVAMDSRRRTFDGHLRRLLLIRDDTCRTPWCDAPVRHADHAMPHHSGGPTAFTNGSGLCERCNQTKESDDWRHGASPDGLDVTTPTGHTYRAPARPLLPGWPTVPGGGTSAEQPDASPPQAVPVGPNQRDRARR